MSALDPGAEAEHTFTDNTPDASVVFDVLEAQFVSIERLVGKLRQSLATEDAPAASSEADSPLQLMQVEELTARIIKVRLCVCVCVCVCVYVCVHALSAISVFTSPCTHS
jgi:hypothetical protein